MQRANVRAIFDHALEIESPDARTAYLDEACAGKPAERQEVEALLRAHAQAGDFLQRPAAEQLEAVPTTPEATLPILDSADKLKAAPSRSRVDQQTVTSAEQNEEGIAPTLTFLQPSTKPGSLGRLGHYEVLEVLGQGGFGIVVKAFDETLHRVVAIKILSPQLAATSPARKRYLREARASAAIRHENVVAIYAVEEQPIPYLVMEYIAGQTLQQKLDQTGPLDVSTVLRLGQQMAAGMAAAHAQGLIHRDIKPSNILLEEGVELRVKITDFGLARAADDASLTQSGVIAGTPMYMSPEQANGEHIDYRADLFSLGSVLYVMCSGRPPFRATTTLGVLKRVTEDTPRPIREIIPEVPDWLCAIIARLHAKNPADRFQSAKEVADLLGQQLAHLQQPALLPLPPAFFQASGRWPPSGKSEHVQRAEQPADIWGPPIPRKHILRYLFGVFVVVGILCWTSILLTRDKQTKQPENLPDVPSPSPPPMAKAPFSAAEARQFQEAWAKDLAAPVENPNSAGTTMILVPPGEFLMGLTDEQVAAALKDKDATDWLYNTYRESRPQHRVTISRPFYIAATEVTIGQFRAFVADTGYRTEAERDGKGGIRWDDQQKKLVQDKNMRWDAPGYDVSRDMPVTQVTWNDAVAYCNWLSHRERLSKRYEATRDSWEPVPGDGYSLPTEAQWEYACKGGTTSTYFCGNDEESLSRYAWYSTNAKGRPHQVGTKWANAFGLFDMHGNASEFCQDYYDAHYYEQSAASDPQGPEIGKAHVRRGGHWDADADAAVSALRQSLLLHDRQWSTGFRVVRELPGVSVQKIDTSEPPQAVAPFNEQRGRQHQQAWAKYLDTKVEIDNSLGMKLALIPPGQFLMGSPVNVMGREAEVPQHPVVLTRPLYLGVSAVTVGQFKAFVKEKAYKTEAEKGGGAYRLFPNRSWRIDPEVNWQNPGFEQTDDHPVVCVSWNDAKAFCAWLSAKEGKQYVLPTEAQWEYCCRAGSTTKFSFGDNDEELAQHAWYWDNSEQMTHPVGLKKPNAWGLYDMEGNVWNWTADWYAADYYQKCPKEDPAGPSEPLNGTRALRGGSWCSNWWDCRAACRHGDCPPVLRHTGIGFRVVLLR